MGPKQTKAWGRKMNNRGLILIVVAVTLSLATIWMVRSWLLSNQISVVEAPQTQHVGPQIIIAKNNMPIGHIVAADDFELVTWPDEDVHAGYLTNNSNAQTSLIGTVVRHGVLAGEPITNARFVAPGQFGFMAAILSPGMRAVTVAVDRTSGLAGFIFPGDRVDLIVTHQIVSGNERERYLSETFLQNARILAVDDRTDDQSGSPELSKTVTIEVTPQIAERINVVLRMGTISLSLRSISNPDDTQSTALSRSQEKPVINSLSRTWDSDVSSVLSPMNESYNGPSIIITRGANVQTVDIEGSK
jgi:pilus assembly protein CpaB